MPAIGFNSRVPTDQPVRVAVIVPQDTPAERRNGIQDEIARHIDIPRHASNYYMGTGYFRDGAWVEDTIAKTGQPLYWRIACRGTPYRAWKPSELAGQLNARGWRWSYLYVDTLSGTVTDLDMARAAGTSGVTRAVREWAEDAGIIPPAEDPNAMDTKKWVGIGIAAAGAALLLVVALRK